MNSEIMHPTTELLTDYIESPTLSEFGDVRNHLINCKECRFEANRLAQFKANLIDEIPHLRNIQLDMDPELQQTYEDAEIEAYVDGALTSAQEQKIGTLLQNDKYALKSALHYATHEMSMASILVGEKTQKIATANKANNANNANNALKRTSLRDTLLQFFEWRPSGWLSIPLTAVTVFTLSVLLLPQVQHADDQRWTLASYQDSQLSRYKPSASPTPGIGFFSSAAVSRQTFENIIISYTKNRLYLNWQAVQDAQRYTFSLYTGNNTQKSLVTTATIDTNSVVIEDLDLQLAQHYIWELTGQTTDQSNFSISGGFVIGDR